MEGTRIGSTVFFTDHTLPMSMWREFPANPAVCQVCMDTGMVLSVDSLVLALHGARVRCPACGQDEYEEGSCDGSVGK